MERVDLIPLIRNDLLQLCRPELPGRAFREIVGGGRATLTRSAALRRCTKIASVLAWLLRGVIP